MAALRWQTATRYYQVKLQRDLFGGLALVCSWGGLRSRQSQQKRIPCADLETARKLVRQIGRQRRRHGYVFQVESQPVLARVAIPRAATTRKPARMQASLPLFDD